MVAGIFVAVCLREKWKDFFHEESLATGKADQFGIALVIIACGDAPGFLLQELFAGWPGILLHQSLLFRL